MGNILNNLLNLFKKKYSKEEKEITNETFEQNLFENQIIKIKNFLDMVQNKIEPIVDSNDKYHLSESNANFIFKYFGLLENWKKLGLVEYDDSFNEEIHKVLEEIKKDSELKFTSLYYDNSGKKKQEEAYKSFKEYLLQSEKVLPKGYLKNEIGDIIVLINQIQNSIEKASTIKYKNINIFSPYDSSKIKALQKKLLNTVTELKNIKQYYERAVLKEDKETLNEFKQRYGIYDMSLEEQLQYGNELNLSPVLVDLSPDAILKKIVDKCGKVSLNKNYSLMPININLYNKIKDIASNITINDQRQENTLNISNMFSELVNDEQINEILHQSNGMTSEQFDYVFNKISKNMSDILSKTVLGSNLFLDYKTGKLEEENTFGVCMCKDSPHYVINISKESILNVENIVDFSRGGLRNVSKLTLPQKQFTYLLSTLAHETSHAIDQSSAEFFNIPPNMKKNDILSYIDFKNLNEKDILLLSQLSPSLRKTLDKLDYDTNLEKCKALAKILKDYEYRKISKEEVFARNVGKSIYDGVLNTFSEKYIDEKDEKMLNSIKAMLEDSNSVNDVIGSLDLEEDMDEAKDLLNSIVSDLNTLQDPELINRLCTNFSLSDLPNEDVVEYEEKATRLLAAYFHLLSKEDKEQLIKDALQSGYYRILNVIPERRLVEEASKEDILEFYNSVSQTDYYDNLLNYEKLEISYIFRNMCNEPEKSRQVLDSLMEQNNVNGVSLFFKNYTLEGNKLLEVFLGDLKPLFNWVKNIPEDIKITHHFNEMLDSLKGVIYSADIDNEIQDRAVSFLNSQSIKAKGLNYEQKLLE